MVATVKHSKTSAVSDSADGSLVQPSDWNADHKLASGSPGDILYSPDGTVINGLAVGASGTVLVGGATPSYSANPIVSSVGIAQGSAGAPSIYPTGDTNTGAWFPAADTVAVSTGGNERLRIDSSGNVGIATDSPTDALTLGGNAARGVVMTRHTTANTAGNSLTIKSGGCASGSTSKTAGDLILSTGTSTGLSAAKIQLQVPVASGGIETTDRVPQTKFCFTQFGLGINNGASDPIANLQINGNMCVAAGSAGSPTFFTQNDTNTGIYFPANDEFSVTTGGTERFRCDSVGRVAFHPPTVLTHHVGIGGTIDRTFGVEQNTTSNTAGSALYVIAGQATNLATDKNGGELRLRGGASTGTGSSFVSFYTATAGTTGTTVRNASEKARITGAGNFGIGTTTPSYLLSLNGNATATMGMERHTTANTAGNELAVLAGGATSGATDKDGGNLALSAGASTGTGTSTMTFLTSKAGAAGTSTNAPTERMRISTDGYLGIGTNAPTEFVHIAGKVRITGATNSAIDIRPGNTTDYYSLAWKSNDAAKRYGNIGPDAGGNGALYIQGTEGIFFATADTIRAKLDSQGNLLIGGNSSPTSTSAAVAIYNGTAPASSLTDGVMLYSEDVSSSAELKVRDEAGNITTLSPHNFSLIGGPSEEMAWAYYSERNGRKINVDMLKMARIIERLSGETLVYTA